MLSAKKSYFLALSQYHQASVAKGKASYGEQVSRLKVRNSTTEVTLHPTDLAVVLL